MEISSLLYLIMAIICSAGMTLALRLLPASSNNRYAALLGNYVTCIIVGFFFLPDQSALFSPDLVTLGLGTIGGILYVVSLVFLQTSIHKNGAVLTAAFSRLGLLVPLAVSIFLFGEKPSILQVAGLALVLIAGSIIQRQDENNDTRTAAAPLLLGLVLLLGGSADAISKFFDHYGSHSQDTLFFFYVFLTAAILTFLLMIYKFKAAGKAIRRRDLFSGILVGIPNYFSSVFLLKSLAGLPGFLVYPAFSTGALLMVLFVSILILKEKLTKRQYLGVAVIIAALILLNI